MKAALPLLTSALALAACVPSAPAPAPAPVALPAPTPTPTPAPVIQAPVIQAPASDNWMDAARTPGDWRYAEQSGDGMALFTNPAGQALLMLECDRETGPGVMLFRAGDGRSARQAVIRTETVTRSFLLAPASNGHSTSINPHNPLLDAMALSKGRFAVEVEGEEALYLPSWAEVSRVIEDCR